MTKADGHKWELKARFRGHGFGWKSPPAILRLKQAVSEIKKVARNELVLAADGAVTLLERLSPALEHVDSSSGAIGTAVNNAIAELVPIIASAPADPATREAWLERLWAAHEADEIPYIERLADYWGELCGSKEVASAWADRLVGITRMALSPDQELRGHFHGTSACLSTLYRAARYAEIVDIAQADTIWPCKQWAVKALAAMGKKPEALRYAESCRGPWTHDGEVGLYEEALALASRTPCDPKTLTRAARDLADEQPAFAVGAGLLALHWLVLGYGYEITGADVWAAYSSTMSSGKSHA